VSEGRYVVFKFWSPILGGNAARISMVDGRGDEHFVIIPDDGGKRFVEAREKVLDRLSAAIDRGDEAGELK
jgi:hypothetical protein